MEEEKASPPPPFERLDITVADIVLFAGWMDEARRAVTEGGGFPEEPSFRSASARRWVRLCSSLHRRWLAEGPHRMALEAQLQFQELHLARLATTLYENIGSLHDSIGGEARAQESRKRAASYIRHFGLRGTGTV